MIPTPIKLVTYWAINDDFWQYLLGDDSLALVWMLLSSNIVKLLLNIVKSCSTQISKDKYRQISSRFITYSINLQILPKDTANKIRESKVSDKKNISLEKKKQLTEAVHVKKVRRNMKVRRCWGKCAWKSYREIEIYRECLVFSNISKFVFFRDWT